MMVQTTATHLLISVTRKATEERIEKSIVPVSTAVPSILKYKGRFAGTGLSHKVLSEDSFLELPWF